MFQVTLTLKLLTFHCFN